MVVEPDAVPDWIWQLDLEVVEPGVVIPMARVPQPPPRRGRRRWRRWRRSEDGFAVAETLPMGRVGQRGFGNQPVLPSPNQLCIFWRCYLISSGFDTTYGKY